MKNRIPDVTFPAEESKLKADHSHWIPESNKSEVDQLDSETAPTCTLSAPSHENSTKKGVANLANPL
ncbi:MAG: hypothetical protein JRE27_01510 [Deltaproteobacteria bacterium]|nr:hypothetical protein [Deltaproteobacteria bacterium]